MSAIRTHLFKVGYCSFVVLFHPTWIKLFLFLCRHYIHHHTIVAGDLHVSFLFLIKSETIFAEFMQCMLGIISDIKHWFQNHNPKPNKTVCKCLKDNIACGFPCHPSIYINIVFVNVCCYNITFVCTFSEGFTQYIKSRHIFGSSYFILPNYILCGNHLFERCMELSGAIYHSVHDIWFIHWIIAKIAYSDSF